MFKPTLSVAAIVAGLLIAQPVSTAYAGNLNVNLDGFSIHIGPDGVTVGAGSSGADDTIYEDATDDGFSDVDVGAGDELVAESVETMESVIAVEPLTCKQGKNLLKRAGYKKVRKLRCGEERHIYKARKNGRKHRLIVDALAGTFARL